MSAVSVIPLANGLTGFANPKSSSFAPVAANTMFPGLQIAMDDAAAMGLIERVSDLRTVFQHLFQGQRPSLQPLRECFSFHALHHQIVGPILMAYVVEDAYVGMI